MTEIVAADIGGTHARFALATVEGSRVVELAQERKFHSADHVSLALAWKAFADAIGRPLPRFAGIAVACPAHGEVLKLTNSPWIIRPASLAAELGLDDFALVNDFGAVGHALAQLGSGDLRHLCGPDRDLPESGTISVIGPGTGLGVAFVRRDGGRYSVGETEGGHVDFAPLDELEDAMLARLRQQFRRVSAERIVSGPGLSNIYGAIAAHSGLAPTIADNTALWTAALHREDALATAALDRFCFSLGSIAGDMALVHGASGVVIAGGLGLRLVDMLPTSGFAQRFVAKGRFETAMSDIPVKIIAYPEPGLLGAAAACAIRLAHG